MCRAFLNKLEASGTIDDAAKNAYSTYATGAKDHSSSQYHKSGEEFAVLIRVWRVAWHL